jgi:hypothetical protein
MLQWKNSAVIAIVLFCTLLSIVLWTKPAFLYDREKKAYKPFRTGTGGTIFPLWIVAIFFGIVSYALTVWILRSTTMSSSPTGDFNRGVMGGLGTNSSSSMPMQMPIPMQPMTMQVPIQPMMTMPMPMSMYSMASTPPPPPPPPVVMSGGGGGHSGAAGGGNDLYDVSRSRVWRNF